MRIVLQIIAIAVWAACVNGCVSGDKSARPEPVRILGSLSNERAHATVYELPGSLSTGGPPQSKWERVLFGPQDSGRRPLRTPQGLAAASRQILVCDQGYPDVFLVDLSAGAMRSVTARKHRPAAPIAVSHDSEQNIYVADATRRSVLSLGPDGSLLFELVDATTEKFEPTAVVAEGGILFIADRGGHRIARYDLGERAWLEPLSPPADHGRLVMPTGLAMGDDGVLLVADAMLSVVHRLTRDGQWLPPLGRRGRGAGELVRPIGVCATPHGWIAVADAGKQSIVVYGRDGTPIIDIAAIDGQWDGWTLPMGVACLPATPEIAGLVTPAGNAQQDWIVVSDMLGRSGLTLISVAIE